MKIYTKTGDQGTTSLFSNQRVSKTDPLIEALGAVDEANSSLGMAVSFLPRALSLDGIRKQIEVIQHALFDLGAAIATPKSSEDIKKVKKTRFDDEAISQLESWIDDLSGKLPTLKHFILPGGHPSGAALHLSRSVVRRAECVVVTLFNQGDIDQNILVYLNRLSDYLFTLARYVNHELLVPETPWEFHKSSQE